MGSLPRLFMEKGYVSSFNVDRILEKLTLNKDLCKAGTALVEFTEDEK